MEIARGKRLLSKEGRVTEIAHLDGDDLHIETREDCTPLVEAAKILSDEPPGKDFRLAAIIPNEVYNQAFREGWLHDKAQWKKWMNDPANVRFRVWKGRM